MGGTSAPTGFFCLFLWDKGLKAETFLRRKQVNLKDMIYVDFRRSELTNFVELAQKNPNCRNFGTKDVVALINTGRTQVIWVKGFYTINVKGQPQVRYLRSERIRLLDGQKWNPLRIGDYARQSGFVISNFHIIEKKLAPLKKQVKELKKEWGIKGIVRAA